MVKYVAKHILRYTYKGADNVRYITYLDRSIKSVLNNTLSKLLYFLPEFENK